MNIWYIINTSSFAFYSKLHEAAGIAQGTTTTAICDWCDNDHANVYINTILSTQ